MITTELQNIILASTSFERVRKLNIEETYELITEVEIKHAFSQNKFLIVEFFYTANFIKEDQGDEEPQVTYNSKHVAQYRLKNFNQENPEEVAEAERFANINAAAMIFPFIRENAATISAKAGMSPILIPVTNFIKMYEEKKSKGIEKSKGRAKRK